MAKVLADLQALLKLEMIEQGIYRGQSQDLGLPALFGGQVMGQAVSAAQQTVVADRYIHSLHSYFLRAGDARKAVVYQVENLRDGKSFTARRVQAKQDGEVIFYMTASFQTQELGFDHQDPMPAVPPPEAVASYSDYIRTHIDHFPQPLRATLLAEKPIEIRPIEQYNWTNPEKMPAKCQMWLKANGQLVADWQRHTCLLAYVSDYHFLPTAIYPHGVSPWHANFQMATIDHAMWFHRPFRLDDWLLYVIDSPSASNGRGLVTGKIFNRQGLLVASTVQEGVIRQY